MESFKPTVEEIEAHTREEAYEMVTGEHVEALGQQLSGIEKTDNLYDVREQFAAVLKEFSFKVQLDNGKVVSAIPLTLQDSQIPADAYEEWGSSAVNGKIQVSTVNHILETVDEYLRTSLGAPFNTDELLADNILLPVVADTIKRLFGKEDN